MLRSESFIGFTILIALIATPLFAHDEGRLHERIAELSNQLASHPEDASLHLERGQLYYQESNWKKALQDFERASKLDPNLVITQFHRGKTLLELGSPGAAKTLLDSYLDRYPDDVFALIARARSLLQLREPRVAALDYDRAIKQSPREEYFFERAQALRTVGEIDEALKGLDTARTKLGLVPFLEVLAVDLEAERAHYDAALIRLDRLAKSSPRAEFWLLRKGEILEKAGRVNEARNVINEALTALERLPVRLRQEKATRNAEARLRAVLDRLPARAEEMTSH